MKAQESRVSDVKLIELPKVHNRAGNISAINAALDVPFDINRVYYLYDIPGGENRGAHAHCELTQLLVAASGSFEVELDDGIEKRSFHLKRPYEGLLLVPGIWRELKEFSSGSICLVLASHSYSEEDYMRNYQEFKLFKGI